jgi:site-specific DNA recombinase
MKPPLRCAIYTRKSTDRGLEQEFNSLEAQREAAEAYIKSQAHEGWRVVPERYDDGGLSGGTLERPALQRLLADVALGRVDTILVYKIDRLTRSLAHFAKVVELFDKHGVSFVSVTQQFNTTTSMGRLTLNVLLSFAQFEREVTGERIRDKIAASKRKGLWMGGPAPLGYRVETRKLVVDAVEAEQVRTIFRHYLNLESLTALMRDLAVREIITKKRPLSSGAVRGGIPFSKGPLAYLLRNRMYLGEVVHAGQTYPGEHDAIIERELFDAVQAKLASQAHAHRQARAGSDALLLGRIFDDRGNRMTPANANKQGVRYRYYVSAPVLQGRREAAGSVPRVAAPDLEELVIAAVRAQTEPPNASSWVGPSPRELVERFVQRVELRPKAVRLELLLASEDENEPDTTSVRTVTVPWSPPRARVRREVVSAGTSADPVKPMRSDTRETLLAAMAKARRWCAELSASPDASFAAIASREGYGERYVRSILPLAFLAPEVITAAVEGRLPESCGVSRLVAHCSPSWREQNEAVTKDV